MDGSVKLHPPAYPDNPPNHPKFVFISLDRRYVWIVANKLEYTAGEPPNAFDCDKVTISERPDTVLFCDNAIRAIYDHVVVIENCRHHRVAVTAREDYISLGAPGYTLEPICPVRHERGGHGPFNIVATAECKVEVDLWNERHA